MILNLLYYITLKWIPGGSIFKCKKRDNYNHKKEKFVYYDTKSQSYKKKEEEQVEVVVNSTENIVLASSNMGGLGYGLITQNTGKSKHFNI